MYAQLILICGHNKTCPVQLTSSETPNAKLNHIGSANEDKYFLYEYAIIHMYIYMYALYTCTCTVVDKRKMEIISSVSTVHVHVFLVTT